MWGKEHITDTIFHLLALLSRIVIALLIVLLLAACGGGRPVVKKVVLAKALDADYRPIDPTTEFSPTDTFYCSVKVSNLKPGSRVTVRWYQDDQLLDEYTLADLEGSQYLGFWYEPWSRWPAGDYRVEIYLNDELARSLDFTVVEPEPTTEPTIGPIVFARGEHNGRPVGVTDSFPLGTKEVYAFFDYTGMTDGIPWRWVWSRSSEEVYSQEDTWQGGKEGNWWVKLSEPEPLPPDQYSLHIYVDGVLQQSGDFVIEVIEGKKIEATATATPVLREGYFSDDFSDPTSGWTTHKEEETITEYSNGVYRISVLEEHWVAWGRARRRIANGVFTVAATPVEGPLDNGYGIVFRYQDGDNFYAFEVSADGYYLLGKYVDDEWINLVDWTKSAAIKQGIGSTNYLKVVADGPEISCYVNDQFLVTVVDESFHEGDCGVLAEAYDEGGVVVEFDDFQVEPVR